MPVTVRRVCADDVAGVFAFRLRRLRLHHRPAPGHRRRRAPTSASSTSRSGIALQHRAPASRSSIAFRIALQHRAPAPFQHRVPASRSSSRPAPPASRSGPAPASRSGPAAPRQRHETRVPVRSDALDRFITPRPWPRPAKMSRPSCRPGCHTCPGRPPASLWLPVLRRRYAWCALLEGVALPGGSAWIAGGWCSWCAWPGPAPGPGILTTAMLHRRCPGHDDVHRPWLRRPCGAT